MGTKYVLLPPAPSRAEGVDPQPSSGADVELDLDLN